MRAGRAGETRGRKKIKDINAALIAQGPFEVACVFADHRPPTSAKTQATSTAIVLIWRTLTFHVHKLRKAGNQLFRGQRLLHDSNQSVIAGFGRAGEAGDHVAVAVDNELREVPADVAFEITGRG